MNSESSIISKIISLQDENGCWNVLSSEDKRFSEFNYYSPNFKSTLWTLIFLADIQINPKTEELIKPIKVISNNFYDINYKIYSLGKSHFPIPCLNGNMLYLLSYFNLEKNLINDLVDFFIKYQRFDDGDFKSPSESPYFSNKSCYGKHSCYWGVIKLFKGLSFIPRNERSQNSQILIKKCIDFILFHEVCFSSHENSKFLHPNICKLTFPNMYQSDFLEILWLLKREKVKSNKMNKALELLKSKRKEDFTWEVEKQLKNLIIPLNKNEINEFITKRAKEVLEFYDF